MSNTVAVYGTLKQGCGNDYLLKGAEMLSTGRIESGHTMVHLGGFPGIVELPVEDERTCPIHVELYKVTSDEMMRSLDRLEGFVSEGDSRNFYDRKTVTVSTEDGEVDALVYFLDEYYLDNPVIHGGIW